MDYWVDFHTHLAHGARQLRSINISTETVPSEGYFSAGLHPWHLNEHSRKFLPQLHTIAQNRSCLAIGECGLDKLKGALPLSDQLPIFTAQVGIAEEVGKPLVLHLVRAYGELLQILRQLRPRVPMWVHGFRGNGVLAKQLIIAGDTWGEGLYLSFGTQWQSTALHVAHAAGRLLIESDTPCGSLIENACKNPLSEIYLRIADELGLTPSQLLSSQQHLFSSLLLPSTA